MFHVEQAWREAFVAGAQALQIPLTDFHIEQFYVYLKELLEWNKKVNLTSITDTREILVKHFLDSLAVDRCLRAGRLLDIGSGAGFPGLPLKILNPDRDVTLLEPNHKKVAFLHHLIGMLSLSGISVVSKRLEELTQRFGGSEHMACQPRFENIVSRAVALGPWLKHLRGLLADGGCVIWCRADYLDPTMQRTGFTVAREEAYALPEGYGRRVLAVFEARRAVPRGTNSRG
jgi:16S rRNA (guanine527-N7)-methyltransferase